MMDSSDRANLIFAIAEVLNEYEEMGYEPEEVRTSALGIVRGWNDGGSP